MINLYIGNNSLEIENIFKNKYKLKYNEVLTLNPTTRCLYFNSESYLLKYIHNNDLINNNSIIFLENVESNFNPKQQEDFCNYILKLSKLGIEFHITTNSYDIQLIFNSISLKNETFIHFHIINL